MGNNESNVPQFKHLIRLVFVQNRKQHSKHIFSFIFKEISLFRESRFLYVYYHIVLNMATIMSLITITICIILNRL